MGPSVGSCVGVRSVLAKQLSFNGDYFGYSCVDCFCMYSCLREIKNRPFLEYPTNVIICNWSVAALLIPEQEQYQGNTNETGQQST